MSEARLKAELAERARAARERLGLSQAEAAQQVGMSAHLYNSMERGAVVPSLFTLVAMTEVLKTSSDHLLGLTREEGMAPLEPRRPEEVELLATVRGWSPEQVRALVHLLRLLGKTPA